MDDRDTTFLWGTSTSAYQIEGGNTNCDWWRYERAEGTHAVEVCGDACDSWNRYEEDLDILAGLGLNAFRLSVEWARIEPEQGVFSREALEHYRRVLEACHARGVTPVVTLHHFTLPLWVADLGGFENPEIVSWMATTPARSATSMGDLIGVACTINEPNIVAIMGYLIGTVPTPGGELGALRRGQRDDARVSRRDARRTQGGTGRLPVGLPLSMQEYEALPGFEDRLNSFREEMEDKYLLALRGEDYVGVQCYTKLIIGPDGVVTDPDGEVTDMGYLYWPQCVDYTVRRAIELSGAPIIVTENGIGTADDTQRVRYLDGRYGLKGLLADGLDVRGYFQWSLLDNFEWTFGYRPRFGLVEVDRETFARTQSRPRSGSPTPCATSLQPRDICLQLRDKAVIETNSKTRAPTIVGATAYLSCSFNTVRRTPRRCSMRRQNLISRGGRSTKVLAAASTLTLLAGLLVWGLPSIPVLASGAADSRVHHGQSGRLAHHTTGSGAAWATARPDSSYYNLNFTNLSAHSCTLYGYPGVSGVTQAGIQLGSAAGRDAEHAPSVITLTSAKTAKGFNDDTHAVAPRSYCRSPTPRTTPRLTCAPVTAAGLRVYPPGQKESTVVPYPYVACGKGGTAVPPRRGRQKYVVGQ
jgi:beta-glucosidase